MSVTIGRTVLICRGLSVSGRVADASEQATHLVYRPATVVFVHDNGCVDLVTFNRSHGGRDRDGISPVRFEPFVPYSLTPARFTWCWPTHVLPAHLDGQPFAIAPAATPDAATSVKSPIPSTDATPGDGESLVHADTAAS